MSSLRDASLEAGLAALLEQLRPPTSPVLLPARAESRTLELWRSVISECLASFFYVFTVCGAAAGVASGGSAPQTLLAASLAAGASIAALTKAFAHISGAHVNPAVSVSMALTRHISLLRGLLYVLSQCGGAIAATALLYGVTGPSRVDSLRAGTVQLPHHLAPWERFGLEAVLSFFVVFLYFVTTDTAGRRSPPTAPLTLGAAYTAATIVSMPSLNPARALGPAFVLNRWDNHWVYWFGPILGGIMAGLMYEFIFNPKRHHRSSKDSIDGDSSSIHSDEDTYDELDKPRSTYNTLHGGHPQGPGHVYRQQGVTTSPNGGYCSSVTSSSVYDGRGRGPSEPLYGGTKSMYCKSPPLTRANLSRSQSVYSKPPMLHQPAARPGPLLPAHSLYPMRINPTPGNGNTTMVNQNQQNQQRLGTEGMYGRAPEKGPSEGMYGRAPEKGPSEGMYGRAPEKGGSEAVYGRVPDKSGQQGYRKTSSGRPESYQGAVPRDDSTRYAPIEHSPAPPPPYHDQPY